jgi:nucleoside-diphosphate-sugar epimerase
MKVLFIGGTGLISSAVSELAVKKGIELYLLNRGNRSELLPEGVRLIKGDIKDFEGTAAALSSHSFDCVVDWIAYNTEDVQRDLKLFREKTGQYMFISTASAYQKPSNNYLINESTPLYNPFWQYSRDKIACEELLLTEYRNNSFPVTIVRPSHTYGKTNIPFIFYSRPNPWTLVDRILRGKRIIVPGDGTSLWTMTHNSDFAKAFTGLIGNNKAIGHAFHITSDDVLTWDEIARCIGRAAGAEPQLTHISSEFIAAFSPENYGSIIGDKSVSSVFDNSKIKSFVPDYVATMPFYEGIRLSVEYFRQRPELCGIDEAFNSLSDRILAAHDMGMEMAKKI